MKKAILFILFTPLMLFGQAYTSYFTGNTLDVITSPNGGICLMGGASEDDNAMKWFLQQANGGDVLVLRASGSNGYNNYLYSQLGIPVNSVESIVCNNASASNDPYIHQKIQQAEAIWFAGGDQWDYVSYWRNTAVDSLVNQAIQQRNIVVGGTSAGMAIMGKYYFSAQNGSVTSAVALGNPYNSKVRVDSSAFIQNALLQDVITDTHFDNPNRKGRLVTFLSRIYADYSVPGKAIACDEYTAVCIDPNGIARVFGGFPADDDNAYFIQTNCELASQSPENCTSGTPLTWNLGGQALKVYQIKGSSDGSKTFDLNDWKTGTGGTWLHWSVNNGVFGEQTGTAVNCTQLSTNASFMEDTFMLYPNPAFDKITVATDRKEWSDYAYLIYNAVGQQLPVKITHTATDKAEIDISAYHPGIYFLQIANQKNQYILRSFVRE